MPKRQISARWVKLLSGIEIPANTALFLGLSASTQNRGRLAFPLASSGRADV